MLFIEYHEYGEDKADKRDELDAVVNTDTLSGVNQEASDAVEDEQ